MRDTKETVVVLRHVVRHGRRVGTVVAATALAGLLGGCGSSTRLVARRCRGDSGRVSVTLRLTNALPGPPERAATVDSVVVVIDDDGGLAMSYPMARPAGAVCEVSQRRTEDSGAVVVYRLDRVGRVLFGGSDLRGGPEADPAMFGRVLVRAH